MVFATDEKQSSVLWAEILLFLASQQQGISKDEWSALTGDLLCDSSSNSPFWLQGILTSMQGVNDRASLLILLCIGRGGLEWSWGLDTACFLLGSTPKSYCRISPLTLKLFAFPLFKEHSNLYINDRNLYINEVFGGFFLGLFSWTPSAGYVVASVA